jgi:hypothetical protein
LATSAFAVDSWKLQYFHDVDGEELHLLAVGFCSERRGIATGYISEGRDTRPAAVVTSDGGATWSLTRPDEAGHAVFFLDETSGWMVTESGIWFTDECGRSWRRIHRRRGLTSVRFVSPERGWAIGANKTVIETHDGGKSWTKVKAVEQIDADPDRTVFDAIDFITPKVGMIVGKTRRVGESSMPAWLQPFPEQKRERPGVSIMVETKDGGASWSASKVSLFGRVSRLRLGGGGVGLALIEFDDYFDYPSEVYELDLRTGKNGPTFRRKDIAITDVLLGDTSFAGGYQLPGKIRGPVPGPVRIASSKNRKDWVDIPVDYRAVATRVSLAKAGSKIWAVTDTGMILGLVAD